MFCPTVIIVHIMMGMKRGLFNVLLRCGLCYMYICFMLFVFLFQAFIHRILALKQHIGSFG